MNWTSRCEVTGSAKKLGAKQKFLQVPNGLIPCCSHLGTMNHRIWDGSNQSNSCRVTASLEIWKSNENAQPRHAMTMLLCFSRPRQFTRTWDGVNLPNNSGLSYSICKVWTDGWVEGWTDKRYRVYIVDMICLYFSIRALMQYKDVI